MSRAFRSSLPLAGVAVGVSAASGSPRVLASSVGMVLLLAAVTFIASAPNPRRIAIGVISCLAVALPATGVGVAGPFDLPDVVPGAILLLTFVPGVARDRPTEDAHRRHWASYIAAAMIIGGILSALASDRDLLPVAKFGMTTLPLVLAMGRLLPDRRETLSLVSGLAGGIVAATVFGLFGPIGGQGRALGLTNHPNQYGVQAVLLLPLLWLLWKSGRLSGPVALAAAAVSSWALLISGSRSGLLALTVVLILWVWHTFGRLGLTTGALLIVVGGAAVALGPGVKLEPGPTTSSIQTPLIQRLRDPESTENSNESRIHLFQEGVGRIADNPLFGTGYPEGPLPHNIVLFVWNGMGLLGLLAFLLLLRLAALQAFLRTSPPEQFALSLAVIAFLAGETFNNSFGLPTAWLLIGLLQAVRLRSPQMEVRDPLRSGQIASPISET